MKDSLTHSIFILLILVSLFISGCLNDARNDVPRSLRVILDIQNAGEIISLNNDSIRVNEIKFHSENFILTTTADDSLITQTGGILFTFTDNSSSNGELVIQGNIGFDDINNFNSVELKVAKPEQNSGIFDSDIITSNESFSLFMTGEFNNSDFIFRSKFSFSRSFPFSTVRLNDNLETIKLEVLSDVSSIFIDSENATILDPGDPNNAERINLLFEQSLIIDASAVNLASEVSF